MNNIVKRISAFAMAFTLIGAGSAIVNNVSSQFGGTAIIASAASYAKNYADHITPLESDCLKKGSSGDKVKWLQCAINKTGIAKLDVDGDFGANTEKAVKAFQQKYKLTTDGKFGKNSLKKMKSVLGISSTKPSGVTQSNYILLCNAVAHEAGSNWITMNEKALVVEVIMNRVASKNFPNTIYKVLAQKNQFSGASSYINLGKFSSQVTVGVKEAVTYYFNNKSSFKHGYLYFWGDGQHNHFS